MDNKTDGDNTAQNDSKKVTIYSTPTCHFCHLAKEFFKENDVSFVEYDVASDMEKQTEMVDKSGQLGVPVIMIGDEVVIGFNEDRLRELLEM